jgi:hypothetical protein
MHRSSECVTYADTRVLSSNTYRNTLSMIAHNITAAVYGANDLATVYSTNTTRRQIA